MGRSFCLARRDRAWAIPAALLALTGTVGASSAGTGGPPPLLLRHPSVSRTQIVFNYADALWLVDRAGGEARQLTSDLGAPTNPRFSPDGTWVAFTADRDGSRDVYVVPATGGTAQRLTHHPVEDVVRGWTPDGAKVLFSSAQNSFAAASSQLYTVTLAGGFPDQLALPRAEQAAFSPDGRRLAYVPHKQWQPAWKRYRGGQTTPIWIADLDTSAVVPLPRDNSNDSHPMWLGNSIYFLSDRNGPVSLFAYDLETRQVSEVLHSDGYDFKSASAGPDAIVIEQFGAIKLYDLSTRRVHDVDIRIHVDTPALRPHFSRVEAKRIGNFDISPTGVRAVFEAGGDIFTVPTDKGDIRNLTRSPAVADRNPAWSPDGRSIAYFTDVSGEYALAIRDQGGRGDVRLLNLGNPSFFYDPVWSPDSRKIAYADKHFALWWIDVETGRRQRVDEDWFGGFSKPEFTPVWSPDSHWLAYSRRLVSGQHALFLHSVEQGKSVQITDGMSDVLFPVFDQNGRYLYFTASTDVALTVQGLDMSSQEHRVSRSVYVIVLNRDDPSPLAPQSDEDPGPPQPMPSATASPKPAAKHAPPSRAAPAARIDLERIGQRILALPVPARNYVGMRAGKSGILFLAEGPMVLTNEGDDMLETLQKFDLAKRKSDVFIEGVNDFTVSRDGERLLYRKGEQWLTASTDDPPAIGAKSAPGLGALKLDDWQMVVDPKPMWKQIYQETWRIERDFFYDRNFHGLDLDKVSRKYFPFLDGLASREELTYLFEECLGELTVGHMFVRGSPAPESHRPKPGLLGADFGIENGRYRIVHVYDGENWNPGLEAPLSQPGVDVKAGEYLIAVGSRELRSSDDIYEALDGTAGRQVVLKVASRPDGGDAREVTVVPVASEQPLRHLAWIEDNRRRVDRATGGRVAYVYMPNTAGAGYTSFNRYYFSQVGKQAVILDERDNEGGQIADYVIDHLARTLMSKVADRDGHDWSSPSQAIYGPKVMIINEMAGSGGDALPWYFRKAALGPLVGKRTWGGLVGIGGYPELIDGGRVTAPRGAIYGLNGEWEVENRGIGPDYDVEFDPQAYRAGHDAQLEKAIEVVQTELAEHPAAVIPRPAYPNYHPNDELSAAPK